MDDPMLGLFDSDSTNFLDELTGGGDALGGTIGGIDGGNMMGPQGPGMMDTMQQQQQQQQAGGWSGMPQQQGMTPQQQKLHHFMDDYGSNQFMGEPSMSRPQPGMGMANTTPRMMSPSQQQQQFGSPPPSNAGPMQSPQHGGGGYPSYPMQHNSPGVTPPRQPTPQPNQMGMNQSPGLWNQSPGSQQPGMSGPPYGNMQQPGGAPRPVGPHGQGQYVPHPEYGLPQNTNHATPMAQQLTQFAEQQQMNNQNNFGSGHPQMGSPPPAQRLSHMPMQNPNAMAMNRPQHQQQMAPGMGQYPRGSQAAMMQSQGNNYSSAQTGMHHPGFNSGSDQVGQQGQLNSGPQMNGMRFPYRGGNQPNMMQAQQGMGPGVGDVPRLTHYPQSPSHQGAGAPFRQPFAGMAGRQMSSPQPMSSPRPTPPPPSLAATGHMQSSPHMATSQGNFSQSSLQQMEQLVPQSTPMSMSSSGFHQGMQQQPVYTVASSAGMNQMGPGIPGNMSQAFSGPQPGVRPNAPVPRTMANMSSTGPPHMQVSMSQMSPMQPQQMQSQQTLQMQQQASQPQPAQINMAGLPPQVQHQMKQMEMEINELQSQIQQLYSMQQTPQSQQKMLDLQERMRTLKAQQQQHIMHQQRQQQQMKQQQIMQQQVKIAPAGAGNMQQQQLMNQQQQQHPPPQQAQVVPVQKQPPPRMPQPGQPMMNQSGPGPVVTPPQPGQMRMPQPNAGQMPLPASAPTSQPVASSLPHQLQQQQQKQQASHMAPQPVAGANAVMGDEKPPQLQSQPGSLNQATPQQVTPPMLQAQPDLNTPQSSDPQLSLKSSPPELSLPDELLQDPTSQDSTGKTSKEQEKANKIIAEAVAKAQSEGREVPSLVNAPAEGTEPEETGKGKKKRSPKKKKEPKTPKEPKQPKPKKTPAKGSKKKKKKGEEEAPAPEAEGDKPAGEGVEGAVPEGEETPKKEAKKKEVKPKPLAKPKSAKKKKTLPTFLLKKKKKKKDDSDEDDADLVAPASPIDDDTIKRRSGRHTKRKKYLDDVDLQLSEEEPSAENQAGATSQGMVMKPENPVDEDTQIVEKILGMRMGKRQKYIPPPETGEVDVVGEVNGELPEPELKPPTSEGENKEAKPETNGADGEEKMETEEKSEVPAPAPKAEKKEEKEKEKEEEDKAPEAAEENNSTEEKKEEPAEEVNTTTAEVNDTKVEDKPSPEKKPADKAEEVTNAAAPAQTDEKKEEKDIEYIEVEEFYVKYKNFSYLHCEWRTADELELGDKRVNQKIKRYKMKRLQQNSIFSQWDDDELFNPDYVEVDRVLDQSVITDPVSGDPVTHYMVKWRGLPYEDSTWELEADVDKSKIEAFKKFREVPPEDDRVVLARPSPKDWVKMEESPVYKNNNTLRAYQLEGVSWLSFSYYNKQNCILADEMGLGKTIQSITFLQQVANYGITGPYLVIVPLSTIGNWQREFETWTDMNVVIYHGSSQSRNMLQEYEMYFKDEKGQRIPEIYKFHALITTFEIIISDCEELSQIEWRVCIIDEAHRLKNRNCKLLEGLKMFDLEHRVLLTGTPLQNNVDELFSLLNFLEPKQFSSSDSFLKEFGDLRSEEQVDKLKAVLKPMMLRRLKEDVEKSLAPKEETIIEVELTNIQKKYYRGILEKNFSFLTKGTTTANTPNLMNTMMELRKCCNHPFLVNGAEEHILAESKAQHGTEPEKQFGAMVNSSGKLVLIDKLLPKLKAGDHRVLIFSQMIRVLDIIEDYLVQKKYLYERIDGRIRGNLRQEAIDRFSKPDSDRFVFLLCTRAGGLGINLTAADTVIIYDSDWNPQNDLQAQARCHRIGQVKAVKVYRLLTRNTYEREMFDKASKKLGLDKAVLQSMGTKELNNQNQLSKKEVEELLKKGAYGSLMEDDSQGDQFCEEDIDSILERRTQVIQIESGEKGSSFSKASFSTNAARSDIEIDDPNFWQKWAKQADIDVDELSNRNDLIIEMPRVRKQTARYGNQDQVLNMSELDTSDSDSELDDAGQRIKKGAKGGKGGRRGRRKRDEDSETEGPIEYYTRGDCFKVEKNLLVYGWGRWEDILLHGRFKRKLQTTDVETLTRAILSFSLRHYAGDERIKQFIFDLISPPVEGEERNYRNHEGLSAPVPRGRKGRKAKKESLNNSQLDEDLAKLDIDPDILLRDEGYKKHLKRHANKVLLRVRLLYYLKQEVIGDQAAKVFMQLPANEINIPTPFTDGDPPAFWWDLESDRSLLIGTYKHGYEKYNLMRQDPCLLFLSRCGPPDSKALQAEQNDDDDIPKDDDEDDDKPTRKKRKKKNADDDDDLDMDDEASTPKPAPIQENMNQPTADGKLPFPSASDLNTRLRRVITGYQRSHKKEIMKQEQMAKRMEKKEKFEAILKERERLKRDSQQIRWSRREEADFYRVVSTFGVERDRHTGHYVWDTFRTLARLDKKYDETLTDYFKAFYFMCRRVCKKIHTEEEAIPPNGIYVEPITEERANRCLARIDLLSKIREQILWHPKLEERLKMCQSSSSMPDWWLCGEHDKDLLIGAAKHGLARTDYHILYDPKLCFREIVKSKIAGEKNEKPATESGPTDQTGLEPGELEPKDKKEADSADKPSTEKSEESEGALNLVKSEIKEEAKPETAEESKDKEDKSSPVKEETEKEKESPVKETKDEVKEKLVEETAEEKKDDEAEVKPEDEKEKKDDSVKEEKMDTGDVKEVPAESKPASSDEKKEESMETDEKKETKEDEEVKTEPSDTEVKGEKPETKEEVKKEEEVKAEPPKEKEKEESVGIKIENLLKAELGKQEPRGNDSDSSIVCMDDHPLAPFRKYMAGHEAAMDMSIEGEDGLGPSFLVDPATSEIMSSAYGNPAIQWPKDRVISHRLENVCHCIEKGEWPPQHKYPLLNLADSRSSTPVAGTPTGGTPKPGTPLAHDYQVMQNAEGLSDGLKMTFQKRRRRRTKAEIEADRAARMREIMGLGVSNVSDVDSDSNISSTHASQLGVDFSPLRREEDSGLSGAERSMEMPMPKRRGRKRKVDKLMEEAQAAAAAAAASNASAAYLSMSPAAGRRMGWPMSMPGTSTPTASSILSIPTTPSTQSVDPDARVSVLNLEDGSRLSGDEAPKQKDLDKWLDEHPGYMVDKHDPEDEVQAELQELGLKSRRGRRKTRVDPNKLELDQVTGEENVSVVNRETGKRITGAKAPPLKYLEEWLKRNPGFDVDPKWYHIVSAKLRLPEELQSRVLKPSGRGRRPNSMISSTTTASSMLNPMDYYSSASMASLAGMTANPSLLASYSKMAAYPYAASMAGLGMNPALYAAQLAQYSSMLSGMHKPGEDSDQEAGEVKKDDDESKKDGDSPSSRSSSTPSMHPSFPYMYNPLLFNQLYAQSIAAANFQLPTNMSTSFASLAAAQQSMMNGMGRTGESEDETEAKPRAEQDSAEDLSVRSRGSKSRSSAQDQVADLSVKKRRREPRHDVSATNLSMDSASTSLDLSMKSRTKQSTSSLDLSVRDSDSFSRRTPETTPEKPKPPVVSKHKSPKALMDVIKELKSNKQKAKGKSVASRDDSGKSSTSPAKSSSTPEKASAENASNETTETS